MGASKPLAVGSFWLSAPGREEAPSVAPVLVLDRLGDPIAAGDGAAAWIDAADGPARTVQCEAVAELVARCTRRRGPVVVDPVVWLLHGNRAAQVSPEGAVAACQDLPPELGHAVAVVLRG